MFDKCCHCAMKHLRAALAYAAYDPMPQVPWPAPQSPVGLYSRAAVLLRERYAYPTHVDLAVGCLVQAEDAAAEAGDRDLALAIRAYRIAVGTGDGLPKPLPTEHLACGHLAEAFREGVLSEPPGVMTSRLFMDEWFVKWVKEASGLSIWNVRKRTDKEVERAEENG